MATLPCILCGFLNTLKIKHLYGFVDLTVHLLCVPIIDVPIFDNLHYTVQHIRCLGPYSFWVATPHTPCFKDLDLLKTSVVVIMKTTFLA